MMASFGCKLEPRVTWEDSFDEGLSILGWPVGMSVRGGGGVLIK